MCRASLIILCHGTALAMVLSHPAAAAAGSRSWGLLMRLAYFEEDELRLCGRPEDSAPDAADPFARFRVGDRVRVVRCGEGTEGGGQRELRGAGASAGALSAAAQHEGATGVCEIWSPAQNEEGEMGPCCSELDMAPITVQLQTR
jgi:hypothetical protein